MQEDIDYLKRKWDTSKEENDNVLLLDMIFNLLLDIFEAIEEIKNNK